MIMITKEEVERHYENLSHERREEMRRYNEAEAKYRWVTLDSPDEVYDEWSKRNDSWAEDIEVWKSKGKAGPRPSIKGTTGYSHFNLAIKVARDMGYRWNRSAGVYVKRKDS